MLTETDFMTKCFVAYFTRERSEILLLRCMFMFEYVSPASIVTPPNMNLWKENDVVLNLNLNVLLRLLSSVT